MRIARKGLGQIEAAPAAAATAPAPFTLWHYFAVAVAAGVTVWLVTRWLDRR